MLWRGFASLLLTALIALSWTGLLDQEAQSATAATLKRALATYAVARGLNGVISVAQGTEIALQPVGVGLTITAGEILDPLNDLVERFSWLVLVACGSLGTQLLLSELLANIWGTEESLEGMNAFLEKRPPDFHQFRERNKGKLDTYLDDFDQGRNQSAVSRTAREG